MGFAEATTSELIEALRVAGLLVPAGLPEAIVGRGKEIVPALCEFVADPKEWDYDHDDPNSGWGPFHAAFLLGAIGDPRAFDAIVAAREPEGDVYEILMDEIPAILCSVGPAALPAMRGFVLNLDNPLFARWGVYEAVVAIGLCHPEHRLSAADVSRECIEEHCRRGEPASEFLLMGLTLSDRDGDWALAVETYEREESDDIPLFDASDLQEMHREGLRGDELERFTRDPMEHFSSRNMALLRHQYNYPVSLTQKKQDDQVVQAHERQRRQKRLAERAAQGATPRSSGHPGTLRNDRCPCGSGKKYKKCCMP